MEAATASGMMTVGRVHAFTVSVLDSPSGTTASVLSLPRRLPPLSDLMEGASRLTRTLAEHLAEREHSSHRVEDVFQEDLRRLDFELVARVRASQLARASLWTLGGSDARGAFEQLRLQRLPHLEPPPRVDRLARVNLEPFAEHLAYAPIIPVESSPIRGESLATILSSGGAAGLVATGADPLLVVAGGAAVGACVVILGLSTTISEILDDRLRRWFGVDRRS